MVYGDIGILFRFKYEIYIWQLIDDFSPAQGPQDCESNCISSPGQRIGV